MSGDLFPQTLPDLPAQIAEVQREIALRERKYPDFVRQGLLTKQQADQQLTTMRAVLHSLEHYDEWRIY